MIDLHLVTQQEVPSKWIENAVASFVYSSHLDTSIDKLGFFNMTIDAIAKSVLFHQPDREFWMAYDEIGLVGYALCSFTIDLDNKLSYQISQAWVRPDYRGRPIVKDWYKILKQHAQDSFCKHIIIPSTRGERAYQRFLSRNLSSYMVVLKEDI